MILLFPNNNLTTSAHNGLKLRTYHVTSILLMICSGCAYVKDGVLTYHKDRHNDGRMEKMYDLLQSEVTTHSDIVIIFKVSDVETMMYRTKRWIHHLPYMDIYLHENDKLYRVKRPNVPIHLAGVPLIQAKNPNAFDATSCELYDEVHRTIVWSKRGEKIKNLLVNI